MKITKWGLGFYLLLTRKEMIELFIKNIIASFVLISFLFFVLKFFERKKFLPKSGVENVKIIPISNEDRIIVFAYNGEEFVIFSSSGSATLLDRKPVRNGYVSDEIQIQKDN